MGDRFIFYVFIAGMILLHQHAGAAQIKWQTYPEALRTAAREKKPLFFHFRSNWCHYCKQMDQKTFSRPRVIDFLNRNFIPVRVSESTDYELMKKFKVNGYPDNRFYDHRGELIFKFYGFQPPDVFMVFLEFVDSGSYKTMDVMTFYEKRR